MSSLQSKFVKVPRIDSNISLFSISLVTYRYDVRSTVLPIFEDLSLNKLSAQAAKRWASMSQKAMKVAYGSNQNFSTSWSGLNAVYSVSPMQYKNLSKSERISIYAKNWVSHHLLRRESSFLRNYLRAWCQTDSMSSQSLQTPLSTAGTISWWSLL